MGRGHCPGRHAGRFRGFVECALEANGSDRFRIPHGIHREESPAAIPGGPDVSGRGSSMTESIRRVVTGHDAHGKSIVLSDGPPPQFHSMLGPSIGADFFEIWSVATAVPILTPTEPQEPNERAFTIMPTSGHLLRIIEI